MFALFALTAGLLAAHDPRSKGYFQLFFEDPIHLKAGFASAVAALACFQLFSAAWIFGKLPWRKPAWVNSAHRWSGRLAFVFTLPVAYHCIFKLGFESPDTRVLAHSLLGCAVYGGFAAKMTIVRLRRFPAPVLPIAGGTLFAVLIGVWYTSAVWLYTRDTPAAAAPQRARARRRKRCGRRERVRAMRIAGRATRSRRPARPARSVPNLDSLRPGYEQARSKVETGGGVMPSFQKRPECSSRSATSRRSSPRAQAHRKERAKPQHAQHVLVQLAAARERRRAHVSPALRRRRS